MFCFNQIRRFAVNSASSLKFKNSNPERIAEYVKHVETGELSRLIDLGLQDPTGDDAKMAVGIISKYVDYVSKHVPYSQSNRRSLAATFKAYFIYSGLPTVYFSYSPDQKGGLVIRFCVPNQTNAIGTFPSDSDEFLHALRTSSNNFVIPIDNFSLTSRLVKNPVGVARGFEQAVNIIHEVLFGIRMSDTYKASQPYQKNAKGIFGRMSRLIAVQESNDNNVAKGLHIHGLGTAEPSSEICRLCADIPFLQRLIVEKLDSYFSCTLPPSVHLEDLKCRIRNSFFSPNPRLSQSNCPTLNTEEEKRAFNKRQFDGTRFVEIHRHVKTCHNGNSGEFGCRSGILYALVEKSGAVLVLFLIDKNVVPSSEFREINPTDDSGTIYEKFAIDDISADSTLSGCRFDEVFPREDSRKILYQLKRNSIEMPVEFNDNTIKQFFGDPLYSGIELTEENSNPELNWRTSEEFQDLLKVYLSKANSRVVTHSPMLLNVIGCNNACYPIGSTSSAKAVIWYIINYILKALIDLEISVVMMAAVRKHNSDYPSVADDKDTAKRKALLFLESSVHYLAGKEELPIVEIAAHNIGLPFNYTSDTQCFVFVKDLMAKQDEIRAKIPQTSFDESSELNEVEADTSDDDKNRNEEEDGEENEESSENNSSLFNSVCNENQFRHGDCRFYTIETADGVEKKIPISDASIFLAKPNELSHIIFYAFQAMFEVKRIPEKERKKNKSDDIEVQEEEEGCDGGDVRCYEEFSEPAKKKRRRPGQQYFDFKDGFELKTFYRLALRAKQLIPIIIIDNIPRVKYLDSSASKKKILANNRKKNQLAEICMSLFCPINSETLLPTFGSSWDNLLQYKSHLLEINPEKHLPTFLGYTIFKFMQNFVDNMNENHDDKKLFAVHRNHARTIWQKEHPRSIDDEGVYRIMNPNFPGGLIDPYKDLVTCFLDKEQKSGIRGEQEKASEKSIQDFFSEILNNLNKSRESGKDVFKNAAFSGYLIANERIYKGMLKIETIDLEVKTLASFGSSVIQSSGFSRIINASDAKMMKTKMNKLSSLQSTEISVEPSFGNFSKLNISNEDLKSWRDRILARKQGNSGNLIVDASDEFVGSKNILIKGPLTAHGKEPQIELIELIIDNALKVRRKEISDTDKLVLPLAVNLLADPGSGKSFFNSILIEQCIYHGFSLVSCAHLSAACTHIICVSKDGRLFPANTLMSTCHLREDEFVGTYKRIDPLPKKQIESNQIIADADIFVVDEVSTCPLTVDVAISDRLKQFTSESSPFCKCPFGDKIFIKMGDLRQEPPVKGQAYYVPAVQRYLFGDPKANYKANSPLDVGTKLILDHYLFKTFTCQNRTSDPDQQRIIQEIGKIDSGRRFSDWAIEQIGQKALTVEDSLDNRIAIMPGNPCRYLLSYYSLIAFAKAKNLPMVIWQHEILGEAEGILESSEVIPKEAKSKLHHIRKELMGIFVKGSPCLLTKKIQTLLGLVNGSEGVMEELVFDASDKDQVTAQEKLNTAIGFQIIDLESVTPYGIIVSFPNKDINTWPEGLSIYDDKVSVIVTEKKKSDFVFNGSIRVQHQCFPLDSATNLTTYKVEGATLENGLIDFNKAPHPGKEMAITSSFVSVSRFRLFHNWGVMPLLEKWEASLSYLKDLRWSDELIAFWHCIDWDGTGKFDPSKFDKTVRDKLSTKFSIKESNNSRLIESAKNFLLSGTLEEKIRLISSLRGDLVNHLLCNVFQVKFNRQKVTRVPDKKKLLLDYFSDSANSAKIDDATTRELENLNKLMSHSSYNDFDGNKVRGGSLTAGSSSKEYGKASSTVGGFGCSSSSSSSSNSRGNISSQFAYWGIPNIGNSCFMGALVQLFAHLKYVSPDDLTLFNNLVSNKLGLFINHIRSSCSDNSTERKQLMVNLYSCIPDLVIGHQQDCHEFFAFFIQALPENTMSLFKIQRKFHCRIENMDIDRGNQIETLFFFEIHFGEGSKDENLELRYAENSDLTLELQGLLDLEMAEIFNFSGDDLDYTFVFTGNAPVYFSFLLKRFRFDAATMIQSKILTKVSIPLELNIPGFESSSGCNYVLQSVVFHIGQSSRSGHYTCLNRVHNDLFLLMNDAKITLLTRVKAILYLAEHCGKTGNDSTCPYILVYLRKDLSDSQSLVNFSAFSEFPSSSTTHGVSSSSSSGPSLNKGGSKPSIDYSIIVDLTADLDDEDFSREKVIEESLNVNFDAIVSFLYDAFGGKQCQLTEEGIAQILANNNHDYYEAYVQLSAIVSSSENEKKKVTFEDVDIDVDDNITNTNMIGHDIVPHNSSISSSVPAFSSSSNSRNAVSFSFTHNETVDKLTHSSSSSLREEPAFQSFSSDSSSGHDLFLNPIYSEDYLRLANGLIAFISCETKRLLEDEHIFVPDLVDINEAVKLIKTHDENFHDCCNEYIKNHAPPSFPSSFAAATKTTNDRVPSDSTGCVLPSRMSSSSSSSSAAAATAAAGGGAPVAPSGDISRVPTISSSSSSFAVLNSAANSRNATNSTNDIVLDSLKQKFYDARFGQLSADETASINSILQGPRTEQVLIEKFNIPMTRAKISCLRPETWLNDEVINYCMSMLEERDINLSAKYPSRKKSHYFNSFFVEKLLGPGHRKYAYKDVERWTSRFDIFELDKIFIPINISQTHWTLAVVFMQLKEIHYYDSMNGEGRKYKQAILKWLIDEASSKKSFTLDARAWKLKSMKDCPQQQNGFDCGGYLIMAANFISDNLPVLEAYYGQRHMSLFRMKLCSYILKGSFDYPID